MKFNNIKIKEKTSLFTFIDSNIKVELFGLDLIIFTLTLIFEMIFKKSFISQIIILIMLLSFIIACLGLFYCLIEISKYYIMLIFGMLKSKYLPLSNEEIESLNIKSTADYLDFIDKFMRINFPLLNKMRLICFINKEQYKSLKDLAEKEYNKPVIITYLTDSQATYKIEENNNIVYISMQASLTELQNVN